MRPIVCIFDTGAGPNLIRADVLDTSGQGSIGQRDMLDIRNAFDTRLKVSGTITLHLGMGGSRTRVNFGFVNEQVVPVLLVAMYTNRLVRSIHLAQKKIFPHHSPPVPVLLYMKRRVKPKIISQISARTLSNNWHCW